jgi:Fe/S biogenesis protein NfuA
MMPHRGGQPIFESPSGYDAPAIWKGAGVSSDEIVITIEDEAVEAIMGLRAQEPDAEDLALSVQITGIRGVEFVYELTFIPIEDAADGDAFSNHGDLPVIVAAKSVDNLRGASIQVRDGGLAIDNPNSPLPKFGGGTGDLSGPLAERVAAVLDHQINPAIASHGGFAELVGVEDATVYLRLGGGCQGCGLAQVTLSQGIEVAIKEAIPEVEQVVDVTDHASGSDPYYESAKK